MIYQCIKFPVVALGFGCLGKMAIESVAGIGSCRILRSMLSKQENKNQEVRLKTAGKLVHGGLKLIFRNATSKLNDFSYSQKSLKCS